MKSSRGYTWSPIRVVKISSAFTASSIQAPVTYVAGTENDQSGDITPGLTADDFTNGATIVTGEELEAGMEEGFTFTLRFAIDELLVTPEGANCDKGDDEGGDRWELGEDPGLAGRRERGQVLGRHQLAAGGARVPQVHHVELEAAARNRWPGPGRRRGRPPLRARGGAAPTGRRWPPSRGR